jgi:hypothetical protein
MRYETGKILKESRAVCFKAPLQHSLGEAEENQTKIYFINLVIYW